MIRSRVPLNNTSKFSASALIESDAEGIGGSGFVECIREHINSVCMAEIGSD